MTDGDWELVEATMDARGHWTVPMEFWPPFPHRSILRPEGQPVFLETRCGRLARYTLSPYGGLDSRAVTCPDCVAFQKHFLG